MVAWVQNLSEGKPPYTYTRIQDQTLFGTGHPFKLPHLHVIRLGSLIKNKVQHIAVVQLLCDFAYVKGLSQLTGTSIILVFFSVPP